MKLRRSGLLAALLVLLVSFPAQALVTDWNYTLSSVFVNSYFTDPTPIGNNYIEITDTKLTWGKPDTANGQSSLEIKPDTIDSTVQTYTGVSPIPSSFWADSVSIIHENYPIYAPSLLGTTMVTTVTLDPTIPDNPEFWPIDFTYVVKFKETPNVGLYQNDVFALTSTLPNWNFQYDDNDDGVFDDYFVNIFASDTGVLSVLPDVYADLAGVPYGTYGFTTEESKATILPFSFTISSARFETPPPPAPEPSTFILFFSGLAGLAFYRRKRK